MLLIVGGAHHQLASHERVHYCQQILLASCHTPGADTRNPMIARMIETFLHWIILQSDQSSLQRSVFVQFHSRLVLTQNSTTFSNCHRSKIHRRQYLEWCELSTARNLFHLRSETSKFATHHQGSVRRTCFIKRDNFVKKSTEIPLKRTR